MSVLDNVIAGRHIRTRAGIMSVLFRWSRAAGEYKKSREHALKWLDFVGLGPKADISVDDLTFAEQRALELARALAGEPELLLVDEFAAGLHVAETEEASKQFLRIRDELGISICLVEHNMDLVMNTADEILVVNFGKKLAEGPPSEIQSNVDVIKAYLGDGIYA
jgi:branched-chain amino acid transport system ATP-binding protein